MASGKISVAKKIIFSLCLGLLIVAVFEGGLRAAYFIKNLRASRIKNFSERLGWEIKPFSSSMHLPKGGDALVYNSYADYGFREFGKLDNSNFRVFVIGDSFTEAVEVSDGKLYFDYLKKERPQVEIFAYGCGGYGTLQEYLILDRYIDLIKPDLILWQFCGNDLINNDHELESLSVWNNNHMIRPYWIGGRIEWRYPEIIPPWLYKILNASVLVRFIRAKTNLVRAELKQPSIESLLACDDRRLLRSIETTRQIMAKVKARAGKTPVVAFCAGQSDFEWSRGDHYEKISRENGIYYLSSFPNAMQRLNDSGVRVDFTPINKHWNETGHAAAGKIISDFLKEQGLEKKIT